MRFVADRSGGAVLEVLACRRQRDGDVGERDVRVGAPATPAGARPGRAARPRTWPRPPAAAAVRSVRDRAASLGGRRLLEDHVRVGAADAERRHARAARALAARPRLGLGQQLDRARPTSRRAATARRRAASAAARRAASPCTILITPADAGRRLGVADVRLDRAEPQRRRSAVLAVGGQQRLRLDRVAQRRARAVRLDGVDVGRRQPGVRQRLADHALLRRAVRRGQAVAARRPG